MKRDETEAEIEKLETLLSALYLRRKDATRERWHRDMPLDEMLFDRWKRSKDLGFGEKTSIYHNSYVYGDVAVGANTWIGPYTLLDGSGGLSIGDFCSISTGVQIYTHDTVKWALSGGAENYEYAPVSIGNCVYVGAQSVIVKGVTIGEHTVIGACSFVNRDIPPNSIAVGTPCKPVGRVELAENGRPLLIIED